MAIARVGAEGDVEVLGSALTRTVGIKGTLRNALGIIDALDLALAPLGLPRGRLDRVLLNEATPVIGDVAMETITETVITESAMIGHNPATPGGRGLGLGETADFAELDGLAAGAGPVIAIIPGGVDFETAARGLNAAMARGVKVAGAIVQRDDGVLIHNRLRQPIPLVDEVRHIELIPRHMPAALEVAAPGRGIQKLANPFDVATLFGLGPEETKRVVPIARALTGLRSAVVIKTPKGDIQARRIPAGSLTLLGERRQETVRVEEGAEAVMAALAKVRPLAEVRAEAGTNAGGMFENVRQVMAELTDQPVSAVQIQDILAVDTVKPQPVLGGLAGELAMGNAVGLAAMVKTHRLPMLRLARKLTEETGVAVGIGGVEAEMAILGALTTPGTEPPLAILDLGGGSTDASLMDARGEVRSIHLAGAGDMVTLLIDTELGLEDRDLAESIKRHPLAKAETLFNLRHEDGTVEFFDQPLDPRLFGRVVVLAEGEMLPLGTSHPLGRVAEVRRAAKQKVFVANALRALQTVAPAGNLRLLGFVVLVGGSALDFEIPGMIADALAEYGVVTGRANVRGCEGPRNAVATGLCLAQGRKRRA